jgi:hypothetical protein
VETLKVAVMLLGIGVPGGVPIVVCEQAISKNAHVSKCQGKTASPAGIGRRGGVADEGDTGTVRMVYPTVRTVERGEGANVLGVLIPFAGDPRLDAGRNEVAHSAVAA